METSLDYLISLLKDKFDYEHVRRNELDNALNIPITIITALLAGLFIVISDKTMACSIESLESIKFILIISLFISSATTIFLLLKVYFGYKRSYCAFPESKIMYEEDFKYLQKHNKKHNLSTYEATLTTHMKEYVVKWYLDCNNQNTPVNDRRGEAMFQARLGLCVSIGLGFLLLILVSYIKYFIKSL